MRLTLRTLLAYIDDRLSPANAREIGQKIAKSPFATDLAERVRDVKRRRRLASLEKATPMIDANLVAEYLDDQLTPELVARVEREILASDSMLAEVAAAHEILGLLRDPVAVEPRLRDRLYGMDPTGHIDVLRVAGTDAVPERESKEAVHQWQPLVVQTSRTNYLPRVLMAVLAAVWLLLVVSDTGLFRPAPVAENKRAPAADGLAADGAAADGPAAGIVAETEGNEIADADRGEKPDPEAADEARVAANSSKPGETSVSSPSSPAAALKSESGKAAAADVRMLSPEREVAVVEDVTAKNAERGAASDTLPENPAGGQAPAMVRNSDSSVVPENLDLTEPAVYWMQGDNRSVLVLNEPLHRWRALRNIAGGEDVVSGPNTVNCWPLTGASWFGITQRFPLQVAAEGKGYRAEVIGPAILRFQKGSSGGLDVLTGRLRVAVDTDILRDENQVPELRLGPGSQPTSVAMLDSSAAFAVEVTTKASRIAPDAVYTPEDAWLPYDADLHVILTVLGGSVSVRQGDAEAVLLRVGQRASWQILEFDRISSFVVDNGGALPSAPAWHFETATPPGVEMAKSQERLLDALARPEEPGDAVLPLLNDRNPQVGVLAVETLSLIRDYGRLLSVLFEARDEAIHRSAIDGLSEMASGSQAARTAIRNSLETRVAKSEAEPLLQLLMGLSEVQSTDPAVAADLMAMLDSDRLAIRTLAIYRMEQVTKDRRGYHPDSDQARRRDAIRRWQRYLDQNSGKLLP